MKERLVVIGNGMAGARLVEDVLARGGARRFEIAMFGDEPYGNYNRILLSSRARRQPRRRRTSSSTPSPGTSRTASRLHAGVPGRRAIDRKRARVTVLARPAAIDASPTTTLVIATGSVPFVPPLDGPGAGGRRLTSPACSCSARSTTAKRSRAYAQNVARGGGDRRRPARPRGRARPARAGPRGPRRPPHAAPDGGAARPAAGRGAAAGRCAGWASASTWRRARPPSSGEERSTGLAVQRRLHARLRHGRDLGRHPARTSPSPARPASRSSAASWSGDDLASPDDPRVYAVGECAQHRGKVYGLVAPLWEQTRCSPTPHRPQARDARYEGSVGEHEAQGHGRRPGGDGREGAGERRGRGRDLLRRRARHLQEADRPRRAAGGRDPARRRRGRAEPRCRSSTARRRLPGSPGGAAVPRRRGASARLACAELPDDAQICNCNGVSKGRLVRRSRGLPAA